MSPRSQRRDSMQARCNATFLFLIATHPANKNTAAIAFSPAFNAG